MALTLLCTVPSGLNLPELALVWGARLRPLALLPPTAALVEENLPLLPLTGVQALFLFDGRLRGSTPAELHPGQSKLKWLSLWSGQGHLAQKVRSCTWSRAASPAPCAQPSACWMESLVSRHITLHSICSLPLWAQSNLLGNFKSFERK